MGSLAILAACSSKPQNGYTVNGQIEGADGQEIVLMQMFSLDSLVRDTTVIANGAFTFEGTVDRPVMASIILGDEQAGDPTKYISLFLEPDAVITISGMTAENIAGGKIEGSPETDLMASYTASVTPLFQEAYELYYGMQNDTIPAETKASMQAKSDSLRQVASKLHKEFMANNPSSYQTAYLLNHEVGMMKLEEMKEAYAKLSPKAQMLATDLAKEINLLETLEPGQPAPDLIGVNPQGNPEKLSDLKGKVVLIDFWATWCKPCVAGLPHVQELYNKYHDKGFDVFMVGDNDSTPEKWAEFIADSKVGMQNYHHILRGLKTLTKEDGSFLGFDSSNDQSDKYAIHFLPTKYLIAADGTIIGRYGENSEEAIDAKLAEIFPENK